MMWKIRKFSLQSGLQLMTTGMLDGVLTNRWNQRNVQFARNCINPYYNHCNMLETPHSESILKCSSIFPNNLTFSDFSWIPFIPASQIASLCGSVGKDFIYTPGPPCLTVTSKCILDHKMGSFSIYKQLNYKHLMLWRMALSINSP